MDSLAVVSQVSTPSPTERPSGTVSSSDELTAPGWLPEFVPVELYQLAVAIALVVVAYYLSKVVRQMLGRRIARRFKRPSVSRTILRGIQAAIVLLAALTGLGFMGLGLGNLALSVGVFSAVVGIVLAPIIGNVISGVFILSEQPYEIGDMIQLEDTQTAGFVEDITLLYTKIFTLDNSFLVMPNGEMRARDVVNYSAEDTRIRMSLEVGVTYESDVGVAREQMEAAAREVEDVIQGGPDIRIGSARYPAAPVCYIQEFGDSEVLFELRYWAKEPYKQTAVRSRVLTNVWRRFDEHGIEIPYPHTHMVFDDTSGELQVATREAEDAVTPQRSGATRREAEAEAEARARARMGDEGDQETGVEPDSRPPGEADGERGGPGDGDDAGSDGEPDGSVDGH
jgi:small-conductance mechanosensitive channel